MAAENVTRAAERTFTLYALYGISVEGVIDTTVQEACRGDGSRATAVCASLPSAGSAPLGSRCSPPSITRFTLVLADLSQLTLARLDRCFDEPIPDPWEASGAVALSHTEGRIHRVR